MPKLNFNFISESSPKKPKIPIATQNNLPLRTERQISPEPMIKNQNIDLEIPEGQRALNIQKVRFPFACAQAFVSEHTEETSLASEVCEVKEDVIAIPVIKKSKSRKPRLKRKKRKVKRREPTQIFISRSSRLLVTTFNQVSTKN